jgi:hypothetical protein
MLLALLKKLEKNKKWTVRLVAGLFFIIKIEMDNIIIDCNITTNCPLNFSPSK